MTCYILLLLLPLLLYIDVSCKTIDERSDPVRAPISLVFSPYTQQLLSSAPLFFFSFPHFSHFPPSFHSSVSPFFSSSSIFSILFILILLRRFIPSLIHVYPVPPLSYTRALFKIVSSTILFPCSFRCVPTVFSFLYISLFLFAVSFFYYYASVMLVTLSIHISRFYYFLSLCVYIERCVLPAQ